MKLVKSVLVAMLLGIMAIQVAWASMIDDLIDSSCKGDLESVKSLIEQGVNVNVENKNGDTPFVKAVMCGHFEVADYLISNGANINSCRKYDSNGRFLYNYTTLKKVAEKGNIEMAQYLVNKDASIDGETLIISIENGNLEVAKYFIEENKHFIEKRIEKRNPNIGNIIGPIELIVAIEKGYADIAKLLIQKSPKDANGYLVALFTRDGGRATDRHGLTPMSYAAEGGMLEIVKMLEDNGLYASNDDIKTAIKNGHFETAKYLIERKIEKTKDSSFGWSAANNILPSAVEKGSLEIVKLLVENGGSVDTRRESGGKYILMLASGNGHLEIVKYLLSKGSHIDDSDDYYRTALIYAIENGQLEVVKYLINYGANINGILNEPQSIPLIVASNKGYIEIVELLVSNGANVNSADRKGKTALLWASEAGNLEVVKFLIAKGEDINKTDIYGKTALMFATESGRLEVVKYLVSLKGIKLNIEDAYGYTATRYANDKEIKKILLKAGAKYH